MQGATLYELGILTSNIHMAWMRTVCGRSKSDYSYSNTIVYNNFPWPETTVLKKKNTYNIIPIGKRKNVFIVMQKKPQRYELRGFFHFGKV